MADRPKAGADLPMAGREGAAERPAYRAGSVTIVGRPNVGKSTLLNRLVGQKISITARKPQTTRQRILGICTTSSHQVVYVDTPGIHRGRSKAINRLMNRAATGAMEGVDLILFLVEAPRWTSEDALIADQVRERAPVILVPNKVDRISEKSMLLPYLREVSAKGEFAAIVPVSGRRGTNVARLEAEILARLPCGPLLFPADQVTNRSERFLVAEILREKLTRRLGQELPYQLAVEVERFEVQRNVVAIEAVIWVERPGHKGIVIGKGGTLLREAGREARLDMESMLGRPVYLRPWVKVRAGWSDDERALRALGYEE